MRRSGGAWGSARGRPYTSALSNCTRTRGRRDKVDALVQLGKVADEVEVVGTDDVSLVVERRRVGGDVDLGRRLEQERLVDRALLCEGSSWSGLARRSRTRRRGRGEGTHRAQEVE